MHLWPSLRIRDSFKLAYLDKLELNLHRMKAEKKKNQSQSPTSTNQQKLLDDPSADQNQGGSSSTGESESGVLVLCREVLLVLSCCYCCFCCGACVEED